MVTILNSAGMFHGEHSGGIEILTEKKIDKISVF